MRVNHRTSTVQTKPWAVVEQGVRLGRGGWRAGPGADRRSTLGGPGRRWASFGRGGGGRSTGGGGGPAPCPERGSGPGWGRWRNASTTGPHGAPPRALRKKRESEEGQSSGGGGGGGRAAQKTWNDRIWARRKEEKDWSMLQEFGESLEERCSLCMKVVWRQEAANSSSWLPNSHRSEAAANHLKRLSVIKKSSRSSAKLRTNTEAGKNIMLLLCSFSSFTLKNLIDIEIQLREINEGASVTQDVYRKRCQARKHLKETLQKAAQCDIHFKSKCPHSKAIWNNWCDFMTLFTESCSWTFGANTKLRRWGPSYLPQCTRQVEPLLWWMCHLVFLWWIIHMRKEKYSYSVGRLHAMYCSWHHLNSKSLILE